MGSMTRPASDSLTVILSRLDARVRRVDEERWLSSRYAAAVERRALVVLYAFYYELARVRLTVSDQTLGQIRFQWWRDALAELQAGEVRQHDVVIALAAEVEADRLDATRLLAIVDRFEAAFLAGDRDAEPETALAETAIAVFGPDAGPVDGLAQIVSAWAKLRRDEPVANAHNRVRVSAVLRPALAHLRLRHPWARGKRPGPMGTRLSILRAVLTGTI